MAEIYNIIVVNEADGCLNSVTNQYTITGCNQTVVVKFDGTNNAVGPFDIYTGSTGTTAVYTGVTRTEMIYGVVLTLTDPSAFCGTPTPTPTPTLTQTPTLTPTLTQTPTNTPSPTATLGLTPTASESPTPTVTPTVTQTPSLSPTITPSNSATPSPTVTPTQTNTQTPSVTATNTETPTNTPSVTATNTETPTNTPSVTATNTETPTNTPSVTATNTETPTNTPSVTATQTPTVTPTNTITPSVTTTVTPTNTATVTPSVTETQTPTVTPTLTQTPTNTATVTPSVTETPTETPTNTPTPTETATNTPTPTETVTPTPTTTPNRNLIVSNFNTSGGMSITFLTELGFTISNYVPPVDFGQSKNAFHTTISSGNTLDVLTSGTTRGTLQLIINTNLIDTNTLDAGSTWNIVFNTGLTENDLVEIRLIDAPTPTPTLTPTNTQTPTVTATVTETPTNTPTYTPTVTETPTNTPTYTPTPSPTSPPFQAYLFIDRNDVTIRNALRDYLAALSATTGNFRGFNLTAPSNVQANFDAQMNAYIAYSGWGVSEPTILTAPISTTSGGNDIWGNPITAYKFQTIQVPNTTVPPAEVAWYTWMVATGMTNGQKYSTIKNGNSNPPSTDTTVSTTFNSLIVNYSGSTNIPAGTYRIYTTKSSAGSNITNGGNNWYFQGGTLVNV